MRYSVILLVVFFSLADVALAIYCPEGKPRDDCLDEKRSNRQTLEDLEHTVNMLELEDSTRKCAEAWTKLMLIEIQRTMRIDGRVIDPSAVNLRDVDKAYSKATETLFKMMWALVHIEDQDEEKVIDLCAGNTRHLGAVKSRMSRDRTRSKRPTAIKPKPSLPASIAGKKTASERLAAFCTEVPQSALCR